MFTALHPRLWGVHFLGLAAVAAAVALGLWQWNVGDGRKADQADQYAHAAPQPLASVIKPGESFPGAQLGRPVRVTGTWVPDSQVTISGSNWIAMAVRSDDSAVYVVVGASRAAASTGDALVSPPSGPADLVGWLQPDQSSTTPAEGRVLPVMSNGLAAPFVPVTLLDAYVVAEKPTAGLTAVPEPQPPKANFWTGLRNWSYAIEWWTFGAFAAYMWWRRIGEMLADDQPSEGQKSA